MAQNNLRKFFVLFLLTSFQLRVGSSVEIEIKPKKVVEGLENGVEISCVPDDMGSQAAEIILIAISRDQFNPLVSIQGGSKVLYGSGGSDRFTAKGFLDKNISKSFLNLKIQNPVSDDNGPYRCLLIYKNEWGYTGEEKASADLVVYGLDIENMVSRIAYLENTVRTLLGKSSNLESQLSAALTQINTMKQNGSHSMNNRITNLEVSNRHNTQKINNIVHNGSHVLERITRLESSDTTHSHQISGMSAKVTGLKTDTTKNAKEIEDLTNKGSAASRRISKLEASRRSTGGGTSSQGSHSSTLTRLERDNRRLSHEIIALVQKVRSTSAFSATTDDLIYIRQDEVLVFPHVLMHRGSDYNSNTGIFTAPFAGLYVFHLSAKVANGGSDIVIQVNGKTVANVFTDDVNKNYEQSSASTVVDLKGKDKVRVFVAQVYAGSVPVIDKGAYSVFSGYLIHKF